MQLSVLQRGASRKLVFQVLSRNVLALRQLEHVLDAVHHLQRPCGRQLAHIPRVEESVLICTETYHFSCMPVAFMLRGH